MRGFCITILLCCALLFIISTQGSAQEIPYSIGTWNADSLGNHRTVVKVNQNADAVYAHILWRRCDTNPGNKGIIIIDAKTGSRIANSASIEMNNEYGDIVFQPASGPGDYYVYYMPYRLGGSRNYPNAVYLKPVKTADDLWLSRNGLDSMSISQKRWATLPAAQTVEMQSIDQFNSFYPMEIIATKEEVASFISKDPDKSYYLFPEDRSNPIRMTDFLPYKWIKGGLTNTFRGEALRGEYYAFQIGIYPIKAPLTTIEVYFTDFTSENRTTKIPAESFTCFNTGGINWDGKPFKKLCAVEQGKVQALWLGVQIDKNTQPGEYTGEIAITSKGMESQKIRVMLIVKNDVLEDAGDSEPWRHSRLRWLNSTVAMDDEIVTPFTPLKVSGTSVSCLGRTVQLGENGLPEQITSFFTAEVTHIGKTGRELLASPIQLSIDTPENIIRSWKARGITITKKKSGAVSWSSVSTAGVFTMMCEAQMEFDGFIEYRLKLTASQKTNVKDIRLEIPLVEYVARYMMGLGLKGGYRPPEHTWKWDVKKHQEGAWLGDVNAGLQFTLRDNNYSRPLNTNFYQTKPLIMPVSWYNEGKGGCDIRQTNKKTVLISAYSGTRTIQVGDTLHFYFTLLITPFKPIDTNAQWSTRFFHSYKPVDEVVKSGANTVNIHHANTVNPYINYPFIHVKEMQDYVSEAHAKGLRVKIYNTIRELSNHAPELFALRSLGTEIFSDGPGGGYSWLQEHLNGTHYISAWFVPQWKDAAVINSGMSRWHNYYIEGLNWLTKNVSIDGLYIDDVAFDRTTMKRVRKILDRNRPNALIDLHSANQYNTRDGFTNSANLYLEHFPYINRLWFGEYFDYNSSSDFWLIEVSGIPFGLMGEMLQNGGNPWRGMIYGMTNRLPYDGNDPTPLWKVWDDFGMQNSQMVGYWSPSCPVKTNNKDILATAYIKKGKTLVSIASWAPNPVNCILTINWKSLGINSKNAILTASEVKNFQKSAVFNPSDSIPIEPGKGWLFVITKK